ncbi:class I SAM-dependent methyltransferase [Actinocorallia longicatena]|uniref:class I SAM-dependent methyltransferase n=1 Tax=Actinocorallia longicatena TaxID=111803 RepID=UPI0031E2405F
MGEESARIDVGGAYDAVAELYTELYGGEFAPLALERGMFGAFAELVGSRGTVLDAGCGPGHVTAYLHAQGLEAFGVDLSPAMVGIARASWPGVRFETGSIEEPDVEDGTLDGIIARYSLIHLPPERIPAVLAAFHRALVPRGHLLLAFPTAIGADAGVRAYDHKVVRAYQWPADRMAGLLREAGFTEVARLLRAAADGERFPEACLLARREH